MQFKNYMYAEKAELSKLVLLVSKKKIGGNHAFFGENKASIWILNSIHCFVFTAF